MQLYFRLAKTCRENTPSIREDNEFMFNILVHSKLPFLVEYFNCCFAFHT